MKSKTSVFKWAGGVWLFSMLFGFLPVLADQKSSRPMLPNFDERVGSDIKPLAVTTNRQLAAAKLRAGIPRAMIDYDELLGTPNWVASPDGFLTGPAGKGRGISTAALAGIPAGEPHRITKAFLNEHRELFGHGAEALAAARIKRDFITPHSGLRTVVWEQQADDIPVFEGLLISHTSKNGELVNLSSHFLANADQAATAGTPNRKSLQAKPRISAPEALAAAVRNINEELRMEEIKPAGIPSDKDPEKHHSFKANSLKGEAETHLVWLPMDGSSLRLCWEVVFMSRARGEMFRVLIDAQTGQALVRHCLTNYISDATYRVYTSDSPSPFSPGHPTPLSTQPALVSRVLVTTNAFNTTASPNGWINDGVNETQGNNVDAHLDRNADNLPDQPRPQGSPFRVFDFTLDLTQDPTNYSSAAVVQLFYLCNWYHDKLYELGFTEAAGNFQVNNFGRGGVGNDPVQADCQDGSGTDNANFSTPSDGSSGRMQMYVWSGPSPRRDGDLDSDIVFHEHTHGLSNRRVGGGVGISAFQTQGMGEGWSDFYALSLVSQPGDDVNGNYAAGGYSTYLLSGLTQNYYFGIRRYPYTTDLSKNPLTFKDIDPAQISSHSGIPINPAVGGGGASEVHNQGEVWCVTLWEVRAKLVNKYGFAAGNQLALQLVTDGMNLSPANPTFLQARDAILQADRIANGGANLNEIWAGFAKRGMGNTATAPANSTTSGVHEAFDVPDSLSLSPASGFTATGPVGGPFTPASQAFTLINSGSNALNWAALNTNSWLTLSQAAGSLAGGASATVTASLNANAGTLPLGVYNGTVWFTNSSTGVAQNRQFVLRSGQIDYFTEIFTNANNDLDNETLTFTPDGSTNYYSVCRETAVSFPTDPLTGTNLALVNHSFLQLTLPVGTNVSIYGIRTNVVFLGSGGFINLLASDTSAAESLATHFSLPRVSGLMAHLHPQDGGAVTWQQLSNRVTFSFLHVPEYGTVNTNNFQMELFFDGRIRITHLAIGTTLGLAGLSGGVGIPSTFQNSDLSSYGPCTLPLTLTVPANAKEGDGILLNQGMARLPIPATTNLTVNLASSYTGKVTVPASVTVLAGQTNATFSLTIVDNAAVDGTQTAVITGSATGFANGTASILVSDNETATLTVSLPATATEGIGTVPGTVSINPAPATNILVNLSSSATSFLQVPAVVSVLGGQTSATFNATIINDNLINGDRTIQVTAHVANWVDGVTSLVLHDNENTNLVVTLPVQAREGDGLLSNAGSVRISGFLPTNLVVSLASDTTTRALVPATATILAGQSNALFNVTIVDNNILDGMQPAVVTASASGFNNGAATINVFDNESPIQPFNPNPAHLATNIIVTTTLGWQSGALAGEVITNDVYISNNPLPGPGDFAGTTTNTAWTLATPLAPLTTYYWQVVARKTGQTASPVWQFTTRGVDHFVWSPIVSTQYVGNPFTAIITAQDAFNTTVSNFTGSVNLSGVAGGGFATNNMLGNTNYTSSGSGSFTVGNSFTPNTNLTVTHVRHYFGTRVSIWTDAGVLLATQNVTSTSGTWLETPLATPLQLTAGTTYRVGVYTGTGGGYYWRNDGGNTFSNGTINLAYEASGDAFPSSTDGVRWWLVDLRYTVAGGLAVPVTPIVSGSFSNGLWTGNVSALALATNLVLRADDGKGHSGVSGPISVSLQNDIAVTMVDSPRPVSLGGNVSYTVTVTNTGPATATGVTLTNVLPGTASFVSAISSQGNCASNGNIISCDLGSLGAASSATVTIIATVSQAGNLTNQVTVYRAETDPYPVNNSATTVTPVLVPSVSINDVTIPEGNSGTTNALFAVSVSPAPVQITSVNFATANGSAVAPGDYLSTNGVVTFAPGETNKIISVMVNGDTLNEANETLVVNLSGATNATIARSQGVGTILNDDPLPALSISDATLVEGNLGTTSAVFTVSLSPASGQAVTVNYATVNATAVSTGDFVAKSGSLTFPPGTTTSNIVVTVNSDLVAEPEENFYVDLSAPVNAALAKKEGLGTIIDDDGVPGQADHFIWSTAASPQYVNEPFSQTITALDAFNNPATSFNGVVSLSGSVAGGQVTTNLLGGVAHTSSSSGTYTLGYSFTPNTNLTVTHVRAYSGTKVSIWTDAGVLLASQAVSGAATVWTETSLAVPLQLNAGSVYRIGFYTAGGTYYWRTNGSSIFANGTINQSCNASGDAFPASTDTARWWQVDLRYSVGSSSAFPITPTISTVFTNGIWTGNLTALAPAPNLVLRADDGNGHNGSGGGMTVLLRNDISVTLTDSPRPVAVGANLTYTITITNSGPTQATGVLLTNLLPASATFISATSTKGSCVNLSNIVSCNLGSLDANGNVVVTVVVTPTAAGNVTNQATVYRAEPDYAANNSVSTVTPVVALPSMSIGDVSLLEGNSGSTNALFVLSLSTPSAQVVTANYATANGGAAAPGDYVATNGVVSFAPGETNKVISIVVNGDPVYETNETFFVNLSNVNNALISKSQGVGTILNDEPLPTFSIGDATVIEGNAGTTTALFTVNLSVPSSLTLAVTYATVNGTAVGGSDFTTKSATLIFTPGLTTANISVTINGDTSVEPDENFYVDLSAPVNATLARREGVGTILNDDGLPGSVDHFLWSAVASPQYVSEPFSGTITALDAFNNPATTFNGTVTLSGTGTGAVPITPAVSGNFINGIWTGQVTALAPTTNLVLRADDGNGHNGLSSALVVLLRNDISVTMVDAPRPASLGANVTYTITVTNSGPSTATGVTLTNLLPAGVSFVSAIASQGSCSNTANVVSCDLGSLGATSNGVVTIVATVLNAGNLTNQATVYRAETDPYLPNNTAITVTPVVAPSVSISDVNLLEGNSGTTNAFFAITLAPASSQTVVVNYATTNGSATAPSDYLAASGVVTFAPGETSKLISVTINGDPNNEPNETFFINISGPTNAVIARSQGVGTILNDDVFGGVAVFYDSRFVDTGSGGVSAEAANVVASLQSMSITTTTFTDMVATASSSHCMLFPEFEVADLSLSLGSTNQVALSNFVMQGGLLIVHGDGFGNAGRFLNSVFSMSVGQLASGVTGPYSLKPEAGGTSFAGGPATLPANNATSSLGTNSLPPGAISIYESAGQSAVALMPRGSGAIIFLGWDWYDAVPKGAQNNGWLTVLATAANLQLIPQQAPVIIAQPNNRTIGMGGTANFTVGAYGTSPMSYQWRKENINIPGATSTAYVIGNVQTNNAGNYSVTVSNAYGVATSTTATLTVISNLPASVLLIWDTNGFGTTALKGALENSGMTVTLSATDETAYNGANPSPSGFDAVIHLNGTTYTIDMPLAGQIALSNYVQNGGGYLHEEWDAYEYGAGRMTNMRELILFDRVGGSNGPVTLTAVPGQAGHPILANVPSSFTFQAGFNTGLAHVFPTNPVTVLMRDSGIDAVAVRQFGTGRVVGFHHSGNYEFGGVPFNTLSNLNVLQLFIDGVRWSARKTGNGPAIISQPASQTAFAGTNVSFSVSASGDQPLNYQWRKAGVNLNNGGPVSGATSATLALASVTASDAAQYSVVVSNAFGSATSSNATLIVNVQPGTDVSLAVSGAPNPVFVGSNVTYSITVTNQGPIAATGVVVTNILPASVSVVAVSSSQGTRSSAGNSHRFALGTLASGSSAQITLIAMATSPGSVTNLANVIENEIDSNPTDNSKATVTVAIGKPIIAATLNNQQLILNWSGTYILQSSTNILGPYLDLPGITRPYTNTMGSPQKFFRLRN